MWWRVKGSGIRYSFIIGTPVHRLFVYCIITFSRPKRPSSSCQIWKSGGQIVKMRLRWVWSQIALIELATCLPMFQATDNDFLGIRSAQMIRLLLYFSITVLLFHRWVLLCAALCVIKNNNNNIIIIRRWNKRFWGSQTIPTVKAVRTGMHLQYSTVTYVQAYVALSNLCH